MARRTLFEGEPFEVEFVPTGGRILEVQGGMNDRLQNMQPGACDLGTYRLIARFACDAQVRAHGMRDG